MSPGADIAGCCQPPDMVIETELWSSRKLTVFFTTELSLQSRTISTLKNTLYIVFSYIPVLSLFLCFLNSSIFSLFILNIFKCAYFKALSHQFQHMKGLWVCFGLN